MVLPNPCPCMLLETGVKVIAIIEVLLTSLGLAVLYLNYAVLANLNPTLEKHKQGLENFKLAVIYSIILVTCQLLLSIGLFFGAVTKNICLCQAWVVITIIEVVSTVIAEILAFVVEVFDTGSPEMATGIVWEIPVSVTVLAICIELYFLFVVFAFIQQLHRFGVGQGGENNNVELGGQLGVGAPTQSEYSTQSMSQQTSTITT
ncbi:unnamed protein product [Orchesella dallaii]|uniref:Transmembrane protein n=1 Tax=Orchesella dallaii TaxID=48710 RepID=A0ABP1QHM4_9HEXA